MAPPVKVCPHLLMKKFIHSNTAVIATAFLIPAIIAFHPTPETATAAHAVLLLELIVGAISAGVILWILPGIIATKRRHSNASSIWLIAIFLGWSIFGWVAALIWACSTDAVKA